MQLKIGITSLGGTHDLWMRYWLAAGNINPDTDVAMVVVPAAQMVANMQTGTLHAFCVGEPWASQLVEKRFGYAAVTTAELWQDHPEKVFALRAAWVDKYPKAAKALLVAIQEAQIWCDTVANQADLVQPSFGPLPSPCARFAASGSGQFGFGQRSPSGYVCLPHQVLEQFCLLSLPQPRCLVFDGEHSLGLPDSADRHQSGRG